MFNRTKYKAIDNPLGFVIRPNKPQRFPMVTKYEDFTDKQKSNLQIIKSVIIGRLGECSIGVFGSQVRGNYDDTSDYDIRIYAKATIEDIRYLKAYDYGVKVDLSFYLNIANSEQNLVLIK